MLALIGKALTRWIVVFDPQLVRLPEKFLPPLTPFTSEIVSAEYAPKFNMYLLGLMNLGRDIFARMLEGTSDFINSWLCRCEYFDFSWDIFWGNRGVLRQAKVWVYYHRYNDHAFCRYHALFPYFFLNSNRGGFITSKHIQHHDCDRTD